MKPSAKYFDFVAGP